MFAGWIVGGLVLGTITGVAMKMLISDSEKVISMEKR
jgi:hypothetical protein